jgi:hypothetical protein
VPSASEGARKTAVAVLQVMAGITTPTIASQALSMSVNRYYQLETRALAAMLRALEPQARGPKRDVEKELDEVRREKARAERETARYQAMLRLSQRAMGLASLSSRAADFKASGAPGKKVRRPRVRAKVVIEAISATACEGADSPPSGEGGTT